MFHDNLIKDINKLREEHDSDIECLEGEVDRSIAEVKTEFIHQIERFKLEYGMVVDTKLLDLQKAVYDKLFTTIESLFKYTKEIQLMDTLAHNIKDEDLARVKAVLLKPILDEKWKQQNTEIANTVSNKLANIIENRNNILHERLKLEREGKDMKFIDGQLSMLDSIIKGAQKT